jgi:hypothetical protein
MPHCLPCLAVVVLLAAQDSCPAQAFIEHLSPPALERGKTTRLTVAGSHLAGALDLWTSLPGGKVKAIPAGDSNADRAVFDVRVADDAPVGVFGLRVATVDGLSNVHLCLIDDLPSRPAPDSTREPARMALPCAVWGRFREGQADRFAIAVQAGQRVSFEAVGNRLGKEVDPLVAIRDVSGRLVAERDNDPGLYFDCRFEHTFAVAGTYTVEVRDARYHGHEHGFYLLRIGRFPAARVAVPSAVWPGKPAHLLLPELNEAVAVQIPGSRYPEVWTVALRRPGDEGSTWLPVEVSEADTTVCAADAVTPEKGTPAAVPGQLCGVLTRPGERQFFRLELYRGQAIQVIGHGRWLNSPIDPEVTLTDATGRTLRQASEGPDDTVQMDFTAPAAGTYCLAVRDLARDGGLAYAYRLEVRTGPPRVDVVAEVEGLTVPRAGYQPVPLTVARGNYAGPIALTLLGAPPGVELTPAEIPAGVNTLVCKLSAGSATPLGLHTLQILAQPTVVSPLKTAGPRTLVKTRPMIDRQLLNVDLIPYSLREDQRRPPPSVADRLALQITEPAPFTVEVAEPNVVLPRYQHAAIPLVTTRQPGFDSPISFTARGGQLAPKEEGRTRVYAEFPVATTKERMVNGSIHSRILANLGKTRIEVLASAVHAGRRITLIRTFELEIRTAFTVAWENPVAPKPLELSPGSTAKVRLAAERLKSFRGPVRVSLSPAVGLDLPEEVVIPGDQASVEIEVKVAKDATPGRRSINLSSTAEVDGFEEEQRGGRIEIEVPRPQPPKKTP